MRIKSLTFSDPRGAGWSFGPLVLKPAMNLFVGASGSGKTKALNILFNIGVCAIHEKFFDAQWSLEFEHAGVEYTWKYEGIGSEGVESQVVASEELWIRVADSLERQLFKRAGAEFSYEGKYSPKLARQHSGIYLLREEDEIKPVFEGFTRLMRRRFWSEDLSVSLSMRTLPRPLVSKLAKRADRSELFKEQQPLHLLMYLLEKFFHSEYELIADQFKRVFPFVEEVQVRMADELLNVPLGEMMPMVFIKEKGIPKPIHLNEVSSGMQKVFLIIADVINSPADIIYMVDEYENSLGVNAIDFLPPFVGECGGKRQFIVTTHHPLLINAIPISDWFVFHRKGTQIRVTHGNELVEKYGKSKQQRFIQLINDPIYKNGVE
jgi:hypothetical protein